MSSGRAPLLVLLLAALALTADASAQEDSVLRDGDGFVQAGPGRVLELPRDHGSHPDMRTEWWYLTGWLEGPAGEPFGFQATWFRRALLRSPPVGRSPLALREVLLFHGVVLQADGGGRHFGEQACRAYPPWAAAAEGRLDVRLFGQQLVDAAGTGEAARLSCSAGETRLELTLDLSAVAPLPHGREPGLSLKGHEPGQASWYYSLPRIPVRGTLELPGAAGLPVTGQAWFDHEFGSMELGRDQVGWDWFSVALDDGSDLMLYLLRRSDGRNDTTSAGTLRTPDGAEQHLGAADFAVTVEDFWTSPRTGTRYPARWRIRVPGHALELGVAPVVSDQELQTPGTTGVTYWEGLCRFEGTRDQQPVSGRGYVELVGHDSPITARFAPRDDGGGALK